MNTNALRKITKVQVTGYIRVVCIAVIFLMVSMPFVGPVEKEFTAEAEGGVPPTARIGAISEDPISCEQLLNIDYSAPWFTNLNEDNKQDIVAYKKGTRSIYYALYQDNGGSGEDSYSWSPFFDLPTESATRAIIIYHLANRFPWSPT